MKGKQYHKYRIVIPESVIKDAGLKEGDDLAVTVEGDGRLRLVRID